MINKFILYFRKNVPVELERNAELQYQNIGMNRSTKRMGQINAKKV
jgi:hypothetical protein